MSLRTLLSRFGPVLAVLLAPVLIRVPAWLLGISLDPLWPTANLTAGSGAPLAPGLPGFMDMEAGWTTQALGTQAATQWLSGRVPWWDPFSGVGLPLAAEMQSSALFLPYVLLFALPGGATMFAIALQATAGLATLLLLRGMGVSRTAATAGAVLFQLGGTFSWIGAPCGLPNAFLPLFLLGIEHARASASGTGGYGFRTMAAAIALSLYAGFPETAYLNGLLALAWAGFRLASLPGAIRIGFAWRVAAGGCAGLALAAPVLGPFAHLLTYSTLGAREIIDMGLIHLPPPGDALYTMPYVLGPIAGFSGFDPGGWLVHLWGRVGGYLGFPLAIGAALGLVGARRHERGLRYLLGVWMLACLVRSASLPWAKDIWEIVPFISQVQFFRYSGGSWMMAACVLAALAIDDHRRRPPARAWVLGIAAVIAVATGLSLAGGWVMVGELLDNGPGYRKFLVASVGWAVLTAALAILSWSIRRPGRHALVAVVLVLDTAVLFAVPLFSGVRRPAIDAEAIGYLQARIGLHRFYTLGPFQPNYGSMFQVASLNHNYLPVPAYWPEYIRAHLDPGADPVLFMGNYPPDTPGVPTRADAVRQNLAAFAQLGVRYVLTGPRSDFAGPIIRTSSAVGPSVPLPLPAGASMRFGVPAGVLRSGRITALEVGLGTYAGSASGLLRVRACADQACATGQMELSGAVDGADGAMALDPPLQVAAGAAIEVTLSHAGGEPVAIWLWNNAGRSVASGDAVLEGKAPRVSLRYGGATPGMAAVRETSSMTIWEVAGAAPYFEAGAGCAVVPEGRETAMVTCGAASTLLRRELWFPGWRATVDGRNVVAARDGELFQRVDIPAGRVRVTFSYRPPLVELYAAVAMLGLVAMADVRRLARRLAVRRRR